MMTHMVAIIFTLLIYLLLGIAYYGWGQIAAHFLGLTNERPESPVIPIWLGWAFTLFIFQVLHLFWPITAYISAPVLVFGVIFAVPQLRNNVEQLAARQSMLTILIFTAILSLGIASWVASRAMLPPINGDSGLYHFNAIRWINTYPVVPGLGNLHGRLAFNQSFFIFVSALNFYPFFEHGRSLANSFLLLLVFATVLPTIVSVILRPSVLLKDHPFRYATDIFLLPIVAYLALSSYDIASPSPDLASTLLQLTMFIVLSHIIAGLKNNQSGQSYNTIVLVVLAATAITIKLSSIAFSSVIIGLALIYIWKTSRAPVKNSIKILMPTTMLILVWGVRGFILSGAPLYPSTIGYMPVEWAVPIENVIEEANWVYSWARMPMTHWENVLGSWKWLHPWFLRILSGRNIINVVYPLALTICFCILATVFRRLNKAKQDYTLEWILFLPMIAGLIFWFVTAPEPRFANAIFFLFSVCSILLFLSSIRGMTRKSMFITTVAIVFFAGNIHFIAYPFHPKSNISISLSGWHPIKKVPLDRKRTSSGLTVHTPKVGDQCWDSPIPSTPYFNDRLRLREPGRMPSGFTVTEQWQDENDVE